MITKKWDKTDRFDADDYNRIKNNTQTVVDLFNVSNEFFVDTIPLTADKTYNDFVYADEINDITDDLELIGKCIGYPLDFEKHNENDRFLIAAELNKIEEAHSPLEELLTNKNESRNHLKIQLGDRGGL